MDRLDQLDLLVQNEVEAHAADRHLNDWMVASMTHKNLKASLNDILFTLTKVVGKTEIVTNGLTFMGEDMTQTAFGNFEMGSNLDLRTRHCLFCVICMRSTVIAVREMFAQTPMERPRMISLLFLVCCNECKVKYNPMYTEMHIKTALYTFFRKNINKVTAGLIYDPACTEMEAIAATTAMAINGLKETRASC